MLENKTNGVMPLFPIDNHWRYDAGSRKIEEVARYGQLAKQKKDQLLMLHDRAKEYKYIYYFLQGNQDIDGNTLGDMGLDGYENQVVCSNHRISQIPSVQLAFEEYCKENDSISFYSADNEDDIDEVIDIMDGGLIGQRDFEEFISTNELIIIYDKDYYLTKREAIEEWFLQDIKDYIKINDSEWI